MFSGILAMVFFMWVGGRGVWMRSQCLPNNAENQAK